MNRLFLFVIIFFIACQNTSVLPSYSGAINEVVVVVEDNIWESNAVDTLRQSLFAEVEGLAWKEPIFDVIQIPKAAFSRFFETHRNIIIIQKGFQSKIAFEPQPFSEDQWLCIIEYKTKKELTQLLNQYSPVIAYKINQKEKDRYRSSSAGLSLSQAIKDRFNASLSLPKPFSLVLDTTNFIWYEYNPKDLELIKGVFVYSFPLTESLSVESVLSARDSLLKQFVPGQLEGSYMTTERLYLPYVSTFEANGATSFTIKGLWKMENAFMGGPFVSYIFQDTLRNEVVVTEGFLFSPGEDKRNALQELSWLISETKIQQQATR